MGEFGSKTRKTGSKVRSSATGDREAYSYNSSSLAVDLDRRDIDDGRTLYLVPAPAAPKPLRAATVPTFGVLDSALKQRDPKSRVISAIVHVVGISAIVWLGMHVRPVIAPALNATKVDFKLFAPSPPPPKILPAPKVQHGGGGGGLHVPVEPTKGRLPEVAKVQLNAPKLRIDHPKLAIEPKTTVNLPEQPKMLNLGATDSPQIKLASQGNGSGGAFGHGLGGGFGSGHGSGAGAGSGGGYGGGLMSVGGGVSAPAVIHSVEPEFTEQARQADFQGTVALQLIVDAQGNPQNVRVTKPLGMGLDEKAIEAVRQYKFRPAMYQGHPVAVQIVVDVEFHLH